MRLRAKSGYLCSEAIRPGGVRMYVYSLSARIWRLTADFRKAFPEEAWAPVNYCIAILRCERPSIPLQPSRAQTVVAQSQKSSTLTKRPTPLAKDLNPTAVSGLGEPYHRSFCGSWGLISSLPLGRRTRIPRYPAYSWNNQGDVRCSSGVSRSYQGCCKGIPSVSHWKRRDVGGTFSVCTN